MRSRSIRVALALAVLTALARAQFSARPSARVDFEYVSPGKDEQGGDRPNYYEASGVSEDQVAEQIEKILFPMTFLRVATDEVDPYVIGVKLEERSDAMDDQDSQLIAAYLVFTLSGGPVAPSAARPLGAGVKYDLRFQEKRGEPGRFRGDLSAKMRELGENHADLVDGLLSHIPVFVRDDAAPRDGYFFQAAEFDEEQGTFGPPGDHLGLPLSAEGLGLMPRAKFLLEAKVKVNQSSRTLFHLVSSSTDSLADLLGEALPSDLSDGISVTSVVEKVGVASTEEVAAPTQPSGAAPPPAKLVASFEPQVPLARPRARLDVHRGPDAAPHPVEIRRIWIAECSSIDAASTQTSPSERAARGTPGPGEPRP